MKRICLLLLVFCLVLSACAPAAAPAGEELQVHFLDVGQADCIFLSCDGQTMLIDGGNVEDSDLVVSYLLDQKVEKLDYVVNTHAHEDHVGGLPAVLAVFETKQVFCPVTEYASSCFEDFVKYADQQYLELVCPEPGTEFSLGSAEVTVLGPVGDYEETNDTSIVLKVEHGSNSFLFTGDAEQAAEKDILDDGFDVSADVLKVGHHGSSSSTSYRWLREVAPSYAVIQVGEGNTYGHPHEEVMSRLYDADVTIYRTDTHGHIVCTSDGQALSFAANTAVEADTGKSDGIDLYIGNTRSKKFHLPDCSGLPSAENSTVFFSYDLALLAGYEPCGNCMG